MSPTLNDVEISREDAEPLDFYKFSIGTNIFYLTNALTATTFSGIIYQPASIERTSPKVSTEETESSIDVSIPSTHALAALFYNVLPTQRGLVEIRRTHKSIVTGASYELVFRGYISNIKYQGTGIAILRCDQPTSFLLQNGPRYIFSNLCNHVLGDGRCKVDLELFKLTAAITAISEDIVTIPGAIAKGADYFDGGYIYYTTAAGEFYHLVLDHAGDQLRVLVPISLPLGSVVTVYAGCKHTLSVCVSKFNNKDNFGGYPYVPFKNPYKTRII